MQTISPASHRLASIISAAHFPGWVGPEPDHASIRLAEQILADPKFVALFKAMDVTAEVAAPDNASNPRPNEALNSKLPLTGSLDNLLASLLASPPTFVTKVRRNSGGESVLGRHYTLANAEAQAAAYNEPHQCDNAYVEPYNAGKAAAAAWPTPGPIRHTTKSESGETRDR